MTRVLLNSGGMDSFFVAQRTQDLHHVFVDIGHAYAEKELQSAQAIADFFHGPMHHVKGAQIGHREHETGIIPYRNAELLLTAAQFGSDLYMGVLKDEMNSDKSPEFFDAMTRVLDISHRPQYWSAGKTHTINNPLMQYSKTELVRELWQGQCGRDATSSVWQALLGTVSCYHGQHQHCGDCASCFKRWVALTAATQVDHGYLFERHPASVHSLAYWGHKGYSASRLQEIVEAYRLAGGWSTDVL
jgi:7-cyano-7-deazaguanine synthase in queuosine biosynthesis